MSEVIIKLSNGYLKAWVQSPLARINNYQLGPYKSQKFKIKMGKAELEISL